MENPKTTEFSLAHHLLRRQRFGKPKGPKVTIAIGVISDVKRSPTIFLASDSQTTYPGAAKSCDTNKLHAVHFCKDAMLVAQAGSAQLGDKVVEIIQREAKDKPFEDEETAARTVQSAMREVRRELVEINKGCNFSADDWCRFWLEQSNLDLVFGYFFDRKPKLFTIDLHHALSIPVKQPYVAIGAGRDMAAYLLREYRKGDPEFEYVWPISVSVVEKTIDNVDGCGRPTCVGIVYPSPPDILRQCNDAKMPFPITHATIVPSHHVELVANELKSHETKSNRRFTKEMKSVLERAQKKFQIELKRESDEAVKEMEKITGKARG